VSNEVLFLRFKMREVRTVSLGRICLFRAVTHLCRGPGSGHLLDCFLKLSRHDLTCSTLVNRQIGIISRAPKKCRKFSVGDKTVDKSSSPQCFGALSPSITTLYPPHGPRSGSRCKLRNIFQSLTRCPDSRLRCRWHRGRNARAQRRFQRALVFAGAIV
jgi:hypothetical protein